MNHNPVRFAVAGLGGYASSITNLLLEEQADPNSMIRLVAACDPNPSGFPERLELLRKHDVMVLESFDHLLRADIQAVWLPVPIDLHRPFAEAALRSGKAVMCEKPPAGSIQDLDAMAAASVAAGKPLLFGYQDIYDPITLAIKRRILSGELGTVQSATIQACWPRDQKYFERNTWAGKLKRNNAWVMDSPVMNALAHPVNQLLYLLGDSEPGSATPIAVEAELYRVNAIENFDTCSIRAALERNMSITIAMSHACHENFGPITTIVGTRGTLEMTFGHVRVTLDGLTTTDARQHSDKMGGMVRSAARHFSGLPVDTALATPDNARKHLMIVNGASQAVAVRTVPESFVDVRQQDENTTLRALRGIEAAVRESGSTGKLFSETPSLPWTSPPGRKDLTRFTHFDGPVT